jgi:hypothetical protein
MTPITASDDYPSAQRSRGLRAWGALIIGLVSLTVACGGGGDGGGDDGNKITEVFLGGATTPGDSCPEGSTEAYRTGHTLVCHECTDDRDCIDAPHGPACRSLCGPGCQDDTSGCCPVRVCKLRTTP